MKRRKWKRERGILTNLALKAIDYLRYYKPLFLLMQGKKIILGGRGGDMERKHCMQV